MFVGGTWDRRRTGNGGWSPGNSTGTSAGNSAIAGIPSFGMSVGCEASGLNALVVGTEGCE
jgi:hypothetical protein